MILFRRFLILSLVYNLYTILSGALVRATSSGAGCGDSWPLCQDQFFPNLNYLKTAIEFNHRMSSGVVLILAIIAFGFSFKFKKHLLLKKLVFITFLTVIFEALFGAGLVIFGLVDQNASFARSVVMCIHLLSTFVLVGSLMMSVLCASRTPISFEFEKMKSNRHSLLIALIIFILISITGAITALCDTLFRPESFGAELWNEVRNPSETLKFLRGLHPIVAIVLVFSFLKAMFRVCRHWGLKKAYLILVSLVSFQVALGFANILLNVPLVSQLLHLFIAHLIWISSVYIFFRASVHLDHHVVSGVGSGAKK